MSTPHHPVAIVGAGLGGLTLARVLRVHGVEAAVFDLDASATARTQGGMLDIHDDSGQPALRAAGLYDAFLAHVHAGGQATRVLDKDARVVLDIPDDGTGGRPEIDRGDLRRLLTGSLPDGVIRWGAKVTGARPLGGGRHEVTLEDGGSFTTDLLVGADGAWSRIRPLVSDARPAYTGVSFVEADLPDADVRHPGSAEVVGAGMLFALGAGRGLLGHRESDGSLHVYTAVEAPEEWLDGIDFTDAEAARRAVLDHFGDWDKCLRALVADAEGPLVPRRIHALPVGHRWDRVPGVTLLGDAAHLMSPFAGEGANLALIDGADLGLALAAHPGDPEAALAAYEEKMFRRAERSAADSAASAAMLFRADAPQGLVDMFTGAGPDGGEMDVSGAAPSA
ncbi:NAD(P)/FAD-dependent oxidoreductase [Streptomyces sp. Ag109_O5-10]|uniref:FAD-dependent oxidoreductase n=1 Tax=Streptomyces sp. Ag109_O5-10 TaxID=1855349 RepID=UPI00089A354B|nr:NAD(P)/FAD-dependent oxidoreductase [Streptomyces sp. Ag109_O5-10]SEF15877.1 2-polyprenyl-6-methoxyphenol hydroxylase [Streptomyces sp. Ag109_O5-10]